MESSPLTLRPKHLALKKDQGLTIKWSDGLTSFYTIAYLRKMSPSADAKQLREELANNPLAILPATAVTGDGPLVAESIELIGHYAVRLIFSDGHDAGIYSWDYLRKLDPNCQAKG